jgi:DNA-binding LytR/AlgR family response regulator
MIRCIAIDDEAPALRVLEKYLSSHADVQLEGVFRNPVEAREWLHLHPVELIFLDISMPQESGMDTFRQLSGEPAVIFTTAHSGYAADAFDLSAVDYLRKPFSYERFCIALDKARDYILLASGQFNAQPVKEEAIVIKESGKVVKIFFSEIQYIEAYQEYIKVFTDSGRHIVYERMKNIEAMLPASRFMRVHRSYIIALDRLKSLQGHTADVAGANIPISREVRERLLNIIYRDKRG